MAITEEKAEVKPLNGKQQLFVNYYCEGDTRGNATQAALSAGYSKTYAEHRMNTMLRRVEVDKAIKARQKEIELQEEITIETINKRFDHIYALSETEKDRVNMLRATENMAKHVGYLLPTLDIPGPIVEYSKDEITEIREIVRIRTIKLAKGK